jgi:putative transposase
LRAEGHAVESICRVLREQGCQVAARTYRDWTRADRPVAARTVSDAVVIDQVRDLAWRVDHEGVRRMTPEGLYGRRKMTALVQRRSPDASPGSVDRAMRSLGLQGIRRCKGIRTTIPGKDGKRAGDLLDRNFTAPAPNRTWVMDFTYVRTWAGFGYVAFILDVYAQRIIAWNVAPTKAVELVDVPLRMALWQRGREGHPVVRGELVGHADAGSQGGFNWLSQHLVLTEVFSGSSTAGSRQGDPAEVEVAWSSDVSTSCRGGVLGRDRQGAVTDRGGRGRRGVAAGGATVVPQRWRHAAVRREFPALGALSLVR